MERRGILHGLAGVAAVVLAGGCAASAEAQTPSMAPSMPPLAHTAPTPFGVQPLTQTVQPASQTPRVPPQPLRGDQIGLLMAALGDAESHGFKPNAFAAPDLSARLRASDPAVRQRADVELRAAVVAYARAQRGLRIPLANFPKNWGMRPTPYDAVADFNFAVSQNKVGPWLDSLPPDFDRYRGLRASLADYRAVADRGGWGVIAAGSKLTLGSQGERVTALRQRLAAEDPSALTDTSSPAFGDDLATAVIEFQRRYGLGESGAVDAATLRALNAPVEDRIASIEANMERWRWVPRIWPTTRIEVNIAGQELDAVRDNAIALEMRAAPGRPTDESPMLASQIESIVLDPPWNVPTSIATKELWPKEHAHPGYLESHGYRLIPTGPDGGVRIQQKYGAKSALGSIKFDFPNAYSVYLHDTPSRRAFNGVSRAVSHGCVRLQRPLDLATLLFDDDPTWTQDHLKEVIDDGKTVRVQLSRPMPVFLMYWTTFLDVKRRVNFRGDVYGWDAELARLLDGKPAIPPPSDADDTDG